ncbi:hypothetical protein OEA41_007001 [Lepraria neglecta]|uniref:Uncharacterized protein n=1 Tax=Lepraria neglecta TaxID=209136 RepID=A0AAD9Z8P8_9LECA|nr:hypothetical protein OEA41_007001 [Lepraria neglecta]
MKAPPADKIIAIASVGNHTSNNTTKPSNQTVANSTSTLYAVNGGAIAGIVIDAVVLGSLLGALAFYTYRHLPSRSAKLSTASRPASPAGDMEHNPDPNARIWIPELSQGTTRATPELPWLDLSGLAAPTETGLDDSVYEIQSFALDAPQRTSVRSYQDYNA